MHATTSFKTVAKTFRKVLAKDNLFSKKDSKHFETTCILNDMPKFQQQFPGNIYI